VSPNPCRRSSDLTALPPRLLLLHSRRDRDKYQGRCAVRNRTRWEPTLMSKDAPRAPLTSPGRLVHDPAVTNTWIGDGSKTNDSIRKWCQDVSRFPLRELADATGHPDPEESLLTPKPAPLPSPFLPSRPRLSGFRHSLPDIHTASHPNQPCKPAFMPCLPKAPSIVQSNEEVLVTSQNIQNKNMPCGQSFISSRPRAHSASECKQGLDSQADSSSISYLHAILRSPGSSSKKAPEESRLGLVLSLVNQYFHSPLGILSLPSSPLSGGGKLGLRVTSDSSVGSTGWSRPWQYPETQIHHSQICRDTPPTNASSQLLETASDAISELDLPPRCYIHEGSGVEKRAEDTLYELVGTYTQKVHDDLRKTCGAVNSRKDYFSCQTEDVMEERYPSECQQSDDEVQAPALYGLSRGRSRRRKPVTVPFAPS